MCYEKSKIAPSFSMPSTNYRISPVKNKKSHLFILLSLNDHHVLSRTKTLFTFLCNFFFFWMSIWNLFVSPGFLQRDACSGPKQLECYESHIIKFTAKRKPIFYLLWLQIIFWKGWKPKPLIDGLAIWSHFTTAKNTAHCFHAEQKAQNNICCRSLGCTKYIIAAKFQNKGAGLLDFNVDLYKCTIMTRTGLASINGLSPSSL